MQMARSSECSALSPADALVVDHYSSKQHWVEFNDDPTRPDTARDGAGRRSEAWSRVNKLFRNLEKDDQCALKMVVIDGMSLEADSATAWGLNDDSSEARETGPQHHREELEVGLTGSLRVAIHLFLESFDGGIECRQLPFSTITPEAQHRQLTFLMLATQALVIGAWAAVERRKHVSVDS